MEFNTNSKAHVLELIEKERMIGVMNNTKWNSLFEALNTIDELLSYRVTYIDGSTWPDAEASFPYTCELAQIWVISWRWSISILTLELSTQKGRY
jgi:hypothetical protein